MTEKEPRAAGAFEFSQSDETRVTQKIIAENGLATEDDVHRYLDEKFGKGNVPFELVKMILEQLK